MKRIAVIIGLLFCLASFISCGIYSFTGISISPDVKTASVLYFQNMTPYVPNLSNTFTDALQQKFVRNTRLTMINSDGDLTLSGEIRGYDISSVAITGGNVAEKNRLTIRVKVKFENKIEPKQNFDREFSAFEEFNRDTDINQVQDDLIEKIVSTLVENIFNASVANW
jgi:hypothetical protein